MARVNLEYSVQHRINAGECPMELSGVLAILSELEDRCRQAWLIADMESERFVDARVTLAIHVADGVQYESPERAAGILDGAELEQPGGVPAVERCFPFEEAVCRSDRRRRP